MIYFIQSSSWTNISINLFIAIPLIIFSSIKVYHFPVVLIIIPYRTKPMLLNQINLSSIVRKNIKIS